MTDLTPETLAERRALWTELRDRGGQDVILTPEFALSLLDALDTEKKYAEGHGPDCYFDMYEAEKAAREEERSDVLIARANAADAALMDAQLSATQLAEERDAAEARAEKAEAALEDANTALKVADVTYDKDTAEIQRLRAKIEESDARADKAERERDEARTELREDRQTAEDAFALARQSRNLNKARADAAEARVAALEAGTAEALSLGDTWFAEGEIDEAVGVLNEIRDALRALTEKDKS